MRGKSYILKIQKLFKCFKFKYFLSAIGYTSRPDFIIIGAQKAGTTSLFNILNQHSLIKGSNKKEIHFFDDDHWYSHNRIYQYHTYFPLPHNVKRGSKVFETTPIYIFHPEAAYRLHKYNPRIKLILILRNPTERAFSSWTMYHHHFKTGKDSYFHDPRSFTEAVQDDLDKLEKITFSEDRISYVKRGIYHYQIEEYLKYFPKEQILFLENSELKNQFEKTSQKIQSFVGVPFEKLNMTELNKGKINDKELYLNDIVKLQNFYAPHNKKLFKLINKEFDWNQSNKESDIANTP
ncbi:MAG: hypothetical protein HKN75_00625 [Bacteroidia bacterium]|nr:hypothetical protein [Bacteroidia bacterium]